MKEIKLRYYTEPDKSSRYIADKGYRIFLNSGQRFRFTDRKDVSRFLTGVSDSLTALMHEIMLITADVQHHIVSAWILFDRIDKSAFDSIYRVTGMMNKLIDRHSYISDSPDGAQFAVNHIGKAAGLLRNAMDGVIMLNKERNLTLEIMKCEFLRDRIILIEKKVDSVGADVLEKVMPR